MINSETFANLLGWEIGPLQGI